MRIPRGGVRAPPSLSSASHRPGPSERDPTVAGGRGAVGRARVPTGFRPPRAPPSHAERGAAGGRTAFAPGAPPAAPPSAPGSEPPEAGRPPASPGGYPKAARLRKDRDFQPVRTRGRRFVGAQVMVRSVGNDAGRARLGVSSPKKYGDAVRRNRFRRLVRAAFRAVASRLPARDLLVEPRRDLGEPDLATLCLDLERAVGPRT